MYRTGGKRDRDSRPSPERPDTTEKTANPTDSLVKEDATKRVGFIFNK